MNSTINSKFDTLKYFCVFIGYPRSGHSLVGSIIDAHPNACITHEMDVVAKYNQFKNNENLFNEMIAMSKQQAISGRQSYGYQYAYIDLFQGESNEISIIGDKKGSGTTQLLIKNENALTQLEQFVRLPLKIIHVTRNPFDIITTKASYKNGQIVPIDSQGILKSIEIIKEEAIMNQKLIDSLKYDIFSFSHEKIISNTNEVLLKLFNFLELKIDSTFIDKIRSKIYTKSNNSRNKYNWSSAEINLVRNQILQLPIFSEYTYE